MLNPKIEAKTLSEDKVIQLSKCPICDSVVMQMYYMEDTTTKKKSKWYHCACGVIFQDKPPTGLYNQAYHDKYAKYDSKIKDVYEYPVKIYAPIIEELIYGRRCLIVGSVTDHQSNLFKSRGWVTYTIDKNTRYEHSRRFIAADFETFTFNSELKFNLIWMYHTLECFINPKAALLKCKELLAEDGILNIYTPDTDFINTRASSGFMHWKSEWNNIMWNIRSLTTYLEQQGFNVIMARPNYEPRFPAQDDFHLIAQKKFY